MTDIQKWLADGGTYEVGAALYVQHGTSAVLKRSFALGPTPFNRNKLREELEKLAAQAPIPAPRTSSLAPKDAPPEVATLITERITSFREAQHLHAQLELLPDDGARLKAATRIRDIFDRNEEIWGAQQHYEAHGALPAPQVTADPAEVPPVPEDAAERVKRRNTLRTYISSKRGTPEKRALWAAELKALEDAIGE